MCKKQSLLAHLSPYSDPFIRMISSDFQRLTRALNKC
jgi:hypothetical protein